MELMTHDLCPGCGHKRWVPFKSFTYKKSRLEYQLCTHCNLAFLNPVPSQNWYNNLYAEQFWESKSKQKSSTGIIQNRVQWEKEFRRSEKFIDLLENTSAGIVPGSRIMEVGCAYGMVIGNLARHFHSIPLGVEPSHRVRDFVERYTEVKIIAENMDYLAEWEPDELLNMIVFSHVMENIVDLDKVFQTTYRLLKPDGLILMDTPNLFFTTSLHIYHPYSFCKRSLYHLFSRHGFEILKITASGRPNMAIIPKYLTVVARKLSGEKETQIKMHGRFPATKLRMKIGQMIYRITCRFPLDMMNKALCHRLYSLGPESQNQLDTIQDKIPSLP